MPDPNAGEDVLATWLIPLREAATFELVVRPGEVVTIVGANGTGKSALATWLLHELPTDVPIKRVLAQRKIWFQYSGAAISAAERSNATESIDRWNRSTNSRYLDHADGQRSSIALFDLLGHINHESRSVVAMYDAGASRAEVDAAFGGRLLKTLNEILERAGLHVSLLLTPEETLETRHLTLGVQYPVHLMSDGEKSALLLAAEILTAPEGAVIVIDEPERHLHRAVSASLIRAILACRDDCAFVVLTHDLDLAGGLSSETGRTLTVSSVEWGVPNQGLMGLTEAQPIAWDLHEVGDSLDVPEAARHAILGGRRQVLFIEGDRDSVDLPLYAEFFPDRLLVPSGGCDLVIRSVAGLRASEALHWIDAAGMVDGDARSEDERASLVSRGVHVLPFMEIENVYYDSAVLDAVANRQSETLGSGAGELLAAARDSAIAALREPGVIERLAKKIARDEVSRRLVSSMPGEISDEEIVIQIQSPLPETQQRLSELLASEDYDALIRNIPIRDTSVRARVARALGFQSISAYEQSALTRIRRSAGLRDSLEVTLR
ncbi:MULTISPECIES: AAA family ATPase [unclassified Microbacterium]|uniref:AAA family ATPase n=1 Tax=unclassified Microbacterium TaxID=2609290 RepID=UPI003414D8F7